MTMYVFCVCVCVHECMCVCVGQLWHKETCDALDKKGRRTKTSTRVKQNVITTRTFQQQQGEMRQWATMQLLCYLKMQQCCMCTYVYVYVWQAVKVKVSYRKALF